MDPVSEQEREASAACGKPHGAEMKTLADSRHTSKSANDDALQISTKPPGGGTPCNQVFKRTLGQNVHKVEKIHIVLGKLISTLKADVELRDVYLLLFSQLMLFIFYMLVMALQFETSNSYEVRSVPP
ncbi:hypothetical protein CYMTET_22738 [Cymbomonas tetramitiformis]|uniref:Uncharacterized protein n=1 Tax=Cymbomonas tetramitiformis TaxID=36881 RepID=A0AAE0G0R7_9CHLO|nr:hypothetical protein CYMTET_22738 [Cymbomonas tetramitiformis]